MPEASNDLDMVACAACLSIPRRSGGDVVAAAVAFLHAS